MVVTVQADPLDRTALAGQGAHDDKDALHPLGRDKTAVGHQTVQAQGDADHGRPIQDRENGHPLPAPVLGQQGKDGADVDRQHEAGSPGLVFLLTTGKLSAGHHQSGAHPSLLGRGVPIGSAGLVRPVALGGGRRSGVVG